MLHAAQRIAFALPIISLWGRLLGTFNNNKKKRILAEKILKYARIDNRKIKRFPRTLGREQK
jgi:hypothetical protein